MERQVNRKPRALLIHPNGIEGMKNLMRVAQALGKQVLRTENPIHVYPPGPRMEIDGVKYFVVAVKEMGCTKTQMQGKDDVGI